MIEVGRGERRLNPRNTAEELPAEYAVPFRVQRMDGPTITGEVVLQKLPPGWRVTALAPRSSLKVPSQGGQRVGSASAADWVAAGAAAVAFCLVTMGLMATVGPRRTMPA